MKALLSRHVVPVDGDRYHCSFTTHQQLQKFHRLLLSSTDASAGHGILLEGLQKDIKVSLAMGLEFGFAVMFAVMQQ